MKKIPSNADWYSFLDVNALRSDADLEDFYDASSDAWEDELDDLGIDIDDVEVCAEFALEAGAYTGEILLFWGVFDLDDVADTLGDRGYEKGDYEGIEIWEDYHTVAMWEGLVTIGSEDHVKEYIEFSEECTNSLYDKVDSEGAVNRLSGGFHVQWQKGPYGPYIIWHEELQESAVALGKKGSDAVRVSNVFAFEDEDAAEDAMDDIRDVFEEYEGYDDDISSIDITRDGRFVEATYEQDIEDMLG